METYVAHLRKMSMQMYPVVATYVVNVGKMSRKMMSPLYIYSVGALKAKAGVGSENVGNFQLEKLREMLHLSALPGFLREKLDHIFPPETRSAMLRHWLPVALLLLGLYRCCSKGGRGSRMMKAPGRPGRWMRRASFEGYPKGYFRDLRAGHDLR